VGLAMIANPENHTYLLIMALFDKEMK